jgi:hypothetical protein
MIWLFIFFFPLPLILALALWNAVAWPKFTAVAPIRSEGKWRGRDPLANLL